MGGGEIFYFYSGLESGGSTLLSVVGGSGCFSPEKPAAAVQVYPILTAR